MIDLKNQQLSSLLLYYLAEMSTFFILYKVYTIT